MTRHHGYNDSTATEWRGLYCPEQSEGRGKRVMDAAHRALTNAGQPIALIDLAPLSGMARPTPAYRRMLVKDGRFTIRKMAYRPIAGTRRTSLAETVSIKETP